jgi:hypothetical protein
MPPGGKIPIPDESPVPPQPTTSVMAARLGVEHGGMELRPPKLFIRKLTASES